MNSELKLLHSFTKDNEFYNICELETGYLLTLESIGLFHTTTPFDTLDKAMFCLIKAIDRYFIQINELTTIKTKYNAHDFITTHRDNETYTLNMNLMRNKGSTFLFEGFNKYVLFHQAKIKRIFPKCEFKESRVKFETTRFLNYLDKNNMVA